MNTEAVIDGPSPPDGEPPSLGQVIAALSRRLNAERIGTGALAELRRITDDALPPAFWRLYLEMVPTEWRERGGHVDVHLDRAWAALIRAMVEMTPHPHSFDRPFGAELATSKYSEDRFVRLLRAEGKGLARELRIAGAWLAHAGVKANWEQPAQLLLGQARRASDVRHRMARDYFRAAAKQSSSQ